MKAVVRIGRHLHVSSPLSEVELTKSVAAGSKRYLLVLT